MKLRGCAWYGLVAVALVVGLAVVSCAPAKPPSTPAAEAWQTYGRAIEIAAITYEEVMIGAGEAYGRGALKAEQLAMIRDAGRVVRESIVAAREGLIAYAEAKAAGVEEPSPGVLIVAMQSQLLELAQLANELGFKYGRKP